MSDSASRLPARPSLEQLQKQAKELLRAYRAGDSAAVEKFGTTGTQTLASAQFAIARQYGFETWAKLKHHIQTLRPPAPLFLSATTPFYQIDWHDNQISVRGPLSESEWDTIFGVMRERRIAKLEAGGISDGAMKHLAELDHVTHLNVAGSKALTDEGAQHQGRMVQLQGLDLGGWETPITDRALEALRHLTELREFKSCWTPGISDAGASNLAGCEHLESVNVMGTPCGDGSIRALTGKPNLRLLRTGRGVTDAGLALLHHFPVFKTWQGGEIRYELMSADAEPNHLVIDGPFTDDGLATLARLDGLFGLTFFWHCPAFTSAGLEQLKHLPRLGILGCQDQHCDDEAMRHIAAIPQLRMLMGQGAVASDQGFEALSRSQAIEFIWGRECPNLTGKGFAALASMPALRGIAVSCKNVDDAALSTLPRFPALRALMPMDVSDEGFRHVGRCENLEQLWCMYCRETGDAATGHIAGLRRLKTYYAGKTRITDRSLEILGRMDSLEKLEFWQCAGLTDSGLAHLAALPRLREISLEGLTGVTRNAAGLFPAHVRVKYSG